MVPSYVVGSNVQLRKVGSTEFDEEGSGELVGIAVTSNKVIYLIFDHSDYMIKEKGCGDFKIMTGVNGTINFSPHRCF